MKDTDLISERHKILSPFFDEKSRRLLTAAESRVIGHGGIGIVSKSTGVSRTTISTGLKELNHPDLIETNRIRKKGGGRKKAVEKLPAMNLYARYVRKIDVHWNIYLMTVHLQ